MSWEDTQKAAAKADLLARARGSAKMFVTKVSPGKDDSPERILFDVSGQTPEQMLAAYAAKYEHYGTLPLDVEGQQMKLYRGQWTIFSGYTGTGKTTLLRQTVCHLLRSGESVFVATLESDPADYIIEIASTAAGVELVNAAQLGVFLEQYGAKLKVWGIIGRARYKEILATIRDLADSDGVRFAVIDSLMVLDVNSKDIEEQRTFADLVNATCLAKQIHIILVAHPKKKISADQRPDTDDVAGSSNIGNLSWNMLFVQRGDPSHDPNITPMTLHILKQRTLGIVGELSGCYYRNHRQFHLDAYAQMPTQYIRGDGIYPASGLTEEIPEHLLNRNAFEVQKTDMSTAPWEI